MGLLSIPVMLFKFVRAGFLKRDFLSRVCIYGFRKSLVCKLYSFQCHSMKIRFLLFGVAGHCNHRKEHARTKEMGFSGTKSINASRTSIAAEVTFVLLNEFLHASESFHWRGEIEYLHLPAFPA